MSVVDPEGADRGRDGEGDTERVSSLSINTGLLYLTRENEVEASDSPIVPTLGFSQNLKLSLFCISNRGKSKTERIISNEHIQSFAKSMRYKLKLSELPLKCSFMIVSSK